MAPRPRFSPDMEMPPLELPGGRKLGSVAAAAFSPAGDLIVLHQHGQPGVPRDAAASESFLPDVVRFGPDGRFIDAWGGPGHIPDIGGVSQWPAWGEGLECDAEGNIWIFGYFLGDDAVLKFSLSGDLLLRIGEREAPGNDDDKCRLGRPTSCYHDSATREVFVADGYGNHRIVAFDSDTGEFTRMWGAYGKEPSSLSSAESFGNPVHKIVAGRDGRLYVCDRIKNRIQEFERTPNGAKFLREVYVAPGTMLFGATFDMAFAPDGLHIYVCDGSNIRVWIVEIDTFSVVGWFGPSLATEGVDNLPPHYGMFHRFALEPSGDLLFCCTTRGLRRMKFIGYS